MEQLQQGSPLALLQLPPHQHQHLRPSGGQLVFALRAHRQLRNVLHLMPENGLFSPDQPLPGVLPQRHPGGEFDAACLHQPTLQARDPHPSPTHTQTLSLGRTPTLTLTLTLTPTLTLTRS